MAAAPKPIDERARLEKLETYAILDTMPEQVFDDITYLASQICGTPTALISLVDAERQWFKSRVGLDTAETHRDLAFCAHAILEPEVLLEVRDAEEDDRFMDNELVLDGTVRFYAGAPLQSEEGSAIGTLCVIDHQPRELDDRQRAALAALSRQVMGQLELRKTLRDLARYQGKLETYQQQLEAVNAELAIERHTDRLTGVANRAGLDRRLDEEVDRAERYGQAVSLLMIDIDYFKVFNDTHGHAAGDEVLTWVARKLDQMRRSSDYVARYGGEEFVVILPETTGAGAAKLADRFRRSVATESRALGTVTISIGVAELRAGETAGGLLRRADDALYAAKRAGRNRVAEASVG